MQSTCPPPVRGLEHNQLRPLKGQAFTLFNQPRPRPPKLECNELNRREPIWGFTMGVVKYLIFR